MNERLIELLREIRPNFGDVGSRDVDVRKKQEQIDEAIALLADGGKGEADAFNRKLRVQLEQEWGDLQNLKRAYAAPQAECAPREAQPVAWVYEIATACDRDGNYYGWERRLSFTMPKVSGSSVRNLQPLAAPTPERAQPISDAMMDLVDRLGSEASEVEPRAWTHLLVYAPERADAAPKLSAKQDFESVWEKARAMDETTKTMARFIWDSAQSAERADAEKDAALTEARKFVAGYTHDNNLWIDSALALLERIDAILAAKEKK
jgi:hypothetical protein